MCRNVRNIRFWHGADCQRSKVRYEKADIPVCQIKMTALLVAPNGLVRLSGILTVCPIVPYLITLPINRLGLTCAH